GQTTLNSSLVTSHSVSLSGLSPSTMYHFRVRSKDSAGDAASSSDFTFTTSASSFSTGWTIPNTILRSVRPPDNFGLGTLDIRHYEFVPAIGGNNGLAWFKNNRNNRDCRWLFRACSSVAGLRVNVDAHDRRKDRFG